MDNLTIKSDPDHNGTFDTTELVDTFTLDSSGHDAGSDPAYDNNGNLTYDGTQAYTYDAWNRLVKVAHAYRDSSGDVQKGSTFDTMAYDGLGRRISQSVTGEGSANDLTTHYYYSTANQILEECNGSDQTIKQQVWGVQYVDELVQEGINSNPATDQTADTTYTVLQDANFNVTGIVNSNGTLVERYEYDAYGARTAYVNGGTNDAGLNLSSSQAARVVIGGVAQAYGIMDFGSQGLLHDDATGLIYNRARYRSTELDRFMSAEPSGGNSYVDGMNLYQVLREDPTSLVDPTGRTSTRARVAAALNEFHNVHRGYLYYEADGGWVTGLQRMVWDKLNAALYWLDENDYTEKSRARATSQAQYDPLFNDMEVDIAPLEPYDIFHELIHVYNDWNDKNNSPARIDEGVAYAASAIALGLEKGLQPLEKEMAKPNPDFNRLVQLWQNTWFINIQPTKVYGVYDKTKDFKITWDDVDRVKAEYFFSANANKLATLYTDEMHKKGFCMSFSTEVDGPDDSEFVVRPLEPIDPHLL